MKWIKNIIIARKLSKKYGVSIMYSTDTRGKYVTFSDGRRPYIQFSPFADDALETLFHEVGHHIDEKLKKPSERMVEREYVHMNLFKIENLDRLHLGGRKLMYVLHSEAFASRFALRALRKTGMIRKESRQLVWFWFTTYTRALYEHFKSSEEKAVVTNLVNDAALKILRG